MKRCQYEVKKMIDKTLLRVFEEGNRGETIALCENAVSADLVVKGLNAHFEIKALEKEIENLEKELARDKADFDQEFDELFNPE